MEDNVQSEGPGAEQTPVTPEVTEAPQQPTEPTPAEPQAPAAGKPGPAPQAPPDPPVDHNTQAEPDEIIPRLIPSQIERPTRVFCMGGPSVNNVCAEYRVVDRKDSDKIYGMVTFQDGPVKESGVNGLGEEDLLLILIDRLRGHQAGPFKTQINEAALSRLESALLNLNTRTKKRIEQGIEGTSKK